MEDNDYFGHSLASAGGMSKTNRVLYGALIEAVRYFAQDTTRRAQTEDLQGYQNCMYRLDKDRYSKRCAVGYFIPDNLYDEDMEGKNASQLVTRYNHCLREDVREAFAQRPIVVDRMQTLHDGDYYWNEKRGLSAAGQKKFKELCHWLRNDY